MTVALDDLPKYLVLEPTSTVRIDMHLDAPACEINVSLDNPRPGRSFVLLIGHPNGPFVQRVRLSGTARIHFDPETPGDYVLLFANPQDDPIVVRLRVTAVGKVPTIRGSRHGLRSKKRERPRTKASTAAKRRPGRPVRARARRAKE